MITPNVFKETDLDVLHGLIRSHPLGTWVTSEDDVLDVNHIPFVLDAAHGEYGVLRGHVNIANPVWRSLPTAKESIVVFQGADSYISPSWYPSKQEHGKVVPTWNYIVLHAHGIPRAITDEEWLFEHLNALTNQHESKRDQPWKVSDAPEEFTSKMVKAIVGIEIPISNLLGTWKASQNKQQPDKEGVVSGLNSTEDARSGEMGSYVSQHTYEQKLTGS
jgi:transcriptional regulator